MTGKNQSYLERGAMMVDAGTNMDDRSLRQVVGDVIGAKVSSSADNELILNSIKADVDDDEDSDDVDVDVDVDVDTDEDDEDEKVCDPDDPDYEECLAELEDDEDDTPTVKSGYIPPKLMTETQLFQKFGQK